VSYTYRIAFQGLAVVRTSAWRQAIATLIFLIVARWHCST
jgi:hypothetical protein